MPPRFFIDLPLADRVGGTLALDEPVARHATRVLRLGVGDPVTLFDGRGGEYAATIVAIGKRDATVRIDAHDPVERESPLQVTLVQAVLASDAMDYAIRKSVELGVASIVPVACVRSQNTGSSERRVEHWRSIAIAACEQCGRNRVPAIDAPVSFAAWLRAPPLPAAIAGPGAAASLAGIATRAALRAIAIGPEGGFTDEELAAAERAGIERAHLGPRVLRAETAAVAALATLNAVIGDAR